MKVLITGGAGFIGSNLVKRCLELNWVVHIVDDLSSGHLEFIPNEWRVNPWVMDFAEKRLLEKIETAGYDYVFHLAALPRVSLSVEQPGKTAEVNTAKTVKLMESCLKGKVKRFVFSSSSSVYGGASMLPTPEDSPRMPKSPYALQKCHVEDYCKMFHNLYGFDSVCLRYFNVFGPNQFGDSPYSTAVSAWCHAIKESLPLRSDGDGFQSRDMTYIDNVVEANILAATNPGSFGGDCFNVGCGERTSNNDILNWFRDKKPGIKVVNAPERIGDVKHTLASLEKINKTLGYEPKVKFWDGLEKTISWWKL